MRTSVVIVVICIVLLVFVNSYGQVPISSSGGGGGGAAGVTSITAATGGLVSPSPLIATGTVGTDPTLIPQLNTSNTFTAGSTQIFTPSAALPGLRVVCGALASMGVTAGNVVCNASSAYALADGTNLNALMTMLGTGVTLAASPTGGQIMLGNVGYNMTALATSGSPNTGQLLITTTAPLSATQSIFGFGAAPTGCPTAANTGCYITINYPAAYIGDPFRFEDNGTQDFVIRKTGTNQIALLFGTADGSGVMLQHTTAGTTLDLKRGDGTLAAGGLGFRSGSYTAWNAGGTPEAVLDGLTGKLITYTGITTAGSGVSPVYAAINAVAQTSTIADGTSLCAAAVCTGGQYVVELYANSSGTCATPGPAVLAFHLTWTDSAGTKTNAVIPIDDNNALTFSASMVLGDTTTYGYARFVLKSTGANPISYGLARTACTTGTATFDYTLSVAQLI